VKDTVETTLLDLQVCVSFAFPDVVDNVTAAAFFVFREQERKRAVAGQALASGAMTSDANKLNLEDLMLFFR
jgi:hypothetical protein